MKKILSILTLATACAATYAIEKPVATVVVQNPKAFFANLTDVMRKVYPDPHSEMTIALSLSPFGYPNFEGVAAKENFAVAIFGNLLAPETFAAIKASKNSAIYKFAQQTNMRRLQKNGWLLFQLQGDPTTDISKYADEVIAVAAQRESSAIAFTLNNIDSLKLLPFPQTPQTKQAISMLKNISEQSQSLKITIDYDGKALLLKSAFAAKSNSDLGNFLNALPMSAQVSEAAFIPQNAMIIGMASANIKAAQAPYEKFIKNLLNSFQVTEESIKAFSKSCQMTTGTFALSMNFKSATEIENVSVSKTEMGLKECLEIYRQTNEVSAKNFGGITDAKTSLKPLSIDGIDACEYTITMPSAEPASNKFYISVYKNYLINTSSIELLKQTFAKIDNPPTEYSLKKYAKAVNGSLIILNNAQIMKLIFAQFGVEFNGEADSTQSYITFGKNEIRTNTILQISTMRAYADIIRKIVELSAQIEQNAAAKVQ